MECFVCEKFYNTDAATADGVPEEYAEQYCSTFCFNTGEASLAAGALLSEKKNLDRSSEATDVKEAAASIIGRYGLKVRA